MILTTEQITTLWQRAFGADRHIESIQELGGGTFNTTYLITFKEVKVILRVSPPQTADTPWDETFLMRSEHALQPYFAPVATLMPETIFIDFTHQTIDRDYMFQTFIEGERWDDVIDELTPAENNMLWEQFGNILKLIHQVRGETFGLPRAGFQFARWSDTVNDRLEHTLHYARDNQIKVPHLSAILEIIRGHPQQLDEIQIPCLLHGDLWLVNLLIRRGKDDPAIVGVLDADRAWWGDPMADWTMFILAHAAENEGHSRFWQAYGRPEATPSARFRKIVYDAMYAGRAFVWAIEHQDQETVTRAEETLREVVETLPTMI